MTNPRKPAAPEPGATKQSDDRVTGIDFREVRTGEDTRQRGWFWHWNELHTEYEPLLKHSGIGLITSYIVWTDRREHSPYRGYAFPSLQSQASFSGSDRAELMTINRILVALDLIEIRKEMVLRVDAQGHKWRVPHNLYRVKDRSGDPHLTAQDVIRVLELAEQRKDVYRHIRHLLTSNFVPISWNNIWYQLLDEVRSTSVWQRLASRATAEEVSFSARSRAGHRSRKSGGGIASDVGPERTPPILRVVPEHGEDAAFYMPGANPTVTGVTDHPQDTLVHTSVAPSNDGSATFVADTNRGFDKDRPSTGAGSNEAPPSSVAPSNPMYDQSLQTTSIRTANKKQAQIRPVTSLPDPVTDVVTSTGTLLSQAGNGPGGEAPSESGPDRAAALIAFAEANGRAPSAADERLLASIAEEVGTLQGWAIVTAAIYEAVDSGSAFVAPKRAREIVRRWLRDGLPGHLRMEWETDDEPESDRASEPADAGTSSVETDHPFWIAEAGIGSAQLWAAVVELMSQRGLARPAEIHDYLKPAVLVERTGPASLRLGVAHELARQCIERRWRSSLEDVLGHLLGGEGWELDIQILGEGSRKSA